MDGGNDSFPLDGVFSTFIGIRLIRDNEGAVIEHYPTSLIGEIRCDLKDKLLLGIILFPLVRFDWIYKAWAFLIVHAIGPWGKRTGLPFWVGVRDPGASLGLPFPWAWQVGLRSYFSNPIKDNLVGIDLHCGKLSLELRMESNDVRLVGICGMGGIGKKTIASYVYNQIYWKFECSSFLEKVTVVYKNKGPLRLQNQFLNCILDGGNKKIINVCQGAHEIKNNFQF